MAAPTHGDIGEQEKSHRFAVAFLLFVLQHLARAAQCHIGTVKRTIVDLPQ